MYLSGRKSRILSELFATLAEAYDEAEIRRHVGELLLGLLEADYYASYVWNSAKHAFAHRISLNMSDSNLDTYERYYQYHDPITPALQERRRPTSVNQIMAQPDLMKTEFFNDFLFRDGLYWGVNLYAWDGADNIGDVRIWRGRRRDNFCAGTLELLDLIRPPFVAALRRTRSTEAGIGSLSAEPGRHLAPDTAPLSLSSREREIARLVVLGYPDKAIASQLGISVTTVRTHLDHAFRKLGVDNRVKLAGWLASHPQDSAKAGSDATGCG